MNTSKLFAMKAADDKLNARLANIHYIDEKDDPWLNLHLAQLFYRKLERGLIKGLEKQMEAGVAEPSVQFLSYDSSFCSMSDPEWSPKAMDGFLDWALSSPHLKRDTLAYSLPSVAYLLETTLGDLDEPELPLLLRYNPCAGISATKLFSLSHGCLPILQHLLGKGLVVRAIPGKLIDQKRIEVGESFQEICVGRWGFEVAFTGEKKSWVPPKLTGVVYDAYQELLKLPDDSGQIHWPALIEPCWADPHMTPEMVEYRQYGIAFTDKMAYDLQKARDLAERCDPGPGVAETCKASMGEASEGCEGVIGEGGFCRTCSKKFIGIDYDLSPCGKRHKTFAIYTESKGEPRIYQETRCDDCLYCVRETGASAQRIRW